MAVDFGKLLPFAISSKIAIIRTNKKSQAKI